MRLIDADAFKEYLQKGTEENADIIPKRLVDTVLDIMEGIMLDIDEQPTIDAVPVVRCKDCRWWDKTDNGFGYCHAEKHCHISAHWEISIFRTYRGDHFCADGEREDDE